ncbi:MAG TPA: hypothetical protein VIJ00_02185 [Nakamurella sp.]
MADRRVSRYLLSMLGFRQSGSIVAGPAVRLAAGAPAAVPEVLAAADPGLVRREIATAADFSAISVPAGDLVANGRVAKFLVDLRDPARPGVLFVNGAFTRNGAVPDEAKYHYDFARAVPHIPERLDDFNRLTYFGPTKRYAAGVLHSYFLGAATEPVFGLQFYPQDVVHEQGVLDVLALVTTKITIPALRSPSWPPVPSRPSAPCAIAWPRPGSEP